MEKATQIFKEDRRIQKTKKLLFEALIALIKTKDYQTITVQDIIDEANVGRSTFYSHFENKEQLLDSGMEPFFEKFLPSGKGSKLSTLEQLSMIYEHAVSHHHIIEVLLRGGASEVVEKQVQKVMLILVDPNGKKIVESKEKRLWRKYRNLAVAEGLVKMLLNWLDDNTVIDAQKMAEISDRFIKVTNEIDFP